MCSVWTTFCKYHDKNKTHKQTDRYHWRSSIYLKECIGWRSLGCVNAIFLRVIEIFLFWSIRDGYLPLSSWCLARRLEADKPMINYTLLLSEINKLLIFNEKLFRSRHLAPQCKYVFSIVYYHNIGINKSYFCVDSCSSSQEVCLYNYWSFMGTTESHSRGVKDSS